MDFMVMLQRGSRFTKVAVLDAEDKVEAVVRVQRFARRNPDYYKSSICMYRELHATDYCPVTA